MTTRRNRRRSVTQVPAPTEPWGDIFEKTKMCKFHLLGICSKGAACPFAHESTEINPLPDLYKTKVCKTLINTGKCGDADCTYAHSKEEMRVADLPGRRGKARGPSGRQSECRPLSRAFGGCKGESRSTGMMSPRTLQQDNQASGLWQSTPAVSNAVHKGFAVATYFGSTSSHMPSSPSSYRQGWQGRLSCRSCPNGTADDTSPQTTLGHTEVGVADIQAQCHNGQDATHSGDEDAVVCADAGFKELFKSGAVAIKNTFLDFEPRPRLRMVQTASGRLDALAAEE